MKFSRAFVSSFFAATSLFVTCSYGYGWIPLSDDRQQTYTRRRHSRSCIFYSSPETKSQTTNQNEHCQPPLTTALLNISYDGAHFTGWSAANQDTAQTESEETFDSDSSLPYRPSRRNRRRQGQRQGRVRSVQGVLRTQLAKLYGNVDPSRVVVEGCSRTDKGVHAQSMVAQFYCLTENFNNPVARIPGKRIPHPVDSWDDSCFEPLAMDLSKLMYVLNRMLPHDVKIRGVATLPSIEGDIPYHPALNAISKTYQYTFSLGAVHDPTQWRHTWHLEHSTNFSILKTRQVCQELLMGTLDFKAFRGAPRGSDDKRRQETESTICTLSEVKLQEVIDETTFPGAPLSTYTLTVTGDRFLYKMMRFLVGALVAVGTDKLTMENVHHALESKSWKGKQFMCAPPHGLILKHVQYNEPIQWITCDNRMSA